MLARFTAINRPVDFCLSEWGRSVADCLSHPELEETRCKVTCVAPKPIEAWNFPTRADKTKNIRSNVFGPIGRDATEPSHLLTPTQDTIEQQMPHREYDVLKAVMISERQSLRKMVGASQHKAGALGSSK